MEQYSIDEVVVWLTEKGFDEDVQKCFRDQAMDGEAISQALGTLPGPDCLKDVVPKFGVRLKVYNAIRSFMRSDESDSETRVEFRDRSPFSPTPSVSSASGFTPKREKKSLESTYQLSDNEIFSPPASTSSFEGSSQSMCGSTPKNPRKIVPASTFFVKKENASGRDQLPDPFPIPQFRERTDINLNQHRLAEDDRKYMVRTLATMLLAHIPKPSKRDCEHVAKSLVRKHSFLKEYHSWSEFIYVRCQNCNRKPVGGVKEKASPAKKTMVKPTAKHIYPLIDIQDFEEDSDITHQRNLELIQKQLRKVKFNLTEISELMARTFKRRRSWILNEVHPIMKICEKYPFLKKTKMVTEEFKLVLQDGHISLDTFQESWLQYAAAVVLYAQACQSKAKDLKSALRSITSDEDMNDNDTIGITALRCLNYFLTHKTRKKDSLSDIDIPFLLVQVNRGTPIAEAIDKNNNHPHIIRFIDDDMEFAPQVFIVTEKQLMHECTNFTSAVFTLMAVHYVFNIDYHSSVKDVLTYIQENILEIRDTSLKKSATYISVEGGIGNFLPN